MGNDGGGQRFLFRKASVAIYDTPKIVSNRLNRVLNKAGYDVVFEGPLKKETAQCNADIWIAKWTFDFNREFLSKCHPVRGIVTLSVGTEHMDLGVTSELGLKVENCPSFSSNSVAEHALALAMRTLYPVSMLPDLKHGQLIFTKFSDNHAEQAVAHMLIRSRQMDDSMARAERYEYYRTDEPEYRHDEPWTNDELSGTKVGIIGSDHSSSELARMLKFGFNCELFEYDTAGELDMYAPHRVSLFQILDTCDYVFLCTDGYGLQKPSIIDSVPGSLAADFRLNRINSERELTPSSIRLTGSRVAVLGTGNIGSTIARMVKLGFGCGVKAFDLNPRDDLRSLGIVYADTVEQAIQDARFIFIALPLNDGTRSLIGWEQLVGLPYDQERILVNVTRDQIIESEPLYSFMVDGGISAYATDVLPNDAILWKGGKPDELTRKFVDHPNVVATPHEGDCSAPSLERMCQEALGKVMSIIGDPK